MSDRQPGDAIEAAADSFTAGNQDWRQQRLPNPVAGEELDLMRRRVRIVAAGGPDETCYVPAEDMLRLFDTIDQQAESIAQLERALKMALRYSQPGEFQFACMWAERDALKQRNESLAESVNHNVDELTRVAGMLREARKGRDEWERRAFQAAEEVRELADSSNSLALLMLSLISAFAASAAR